MRIVKLILPKPETLNETSDFILFLAFYPNTSRNHYICRPDIFIWTYMRTWYAFGMRMCAKRDFERVSRKKVRDTKTFGGAENFSKSRGTSEIFKVRVPRWFQGIWSPLKVAFPERFLNHKLNLTPRRSLTIYMAADNEIYCWTKVENFWRVSTTFCRGASAEIRRPNGYFY